MYERAMPKIFVVASFSIAGRPFNVGLAMLTLVAISLSGCGGPDRYAKSIEVGRMNQRYEGRVEGVNLSFLTAEEKKGAIEHLDRIRSAYLKMIEMKKVEVKHGMKDWSFPVVLQSHLLVVAQARALRDEFLPASSLSDEEKKQGAKTCDVIICVAKQLPSSWHDSLLHSLGPELTRLRDDIAAGDGEKAEPRPQALKPEKAPAAKATNTDQEVRQALAHLRRALVDAKVNKDVEGPCVVDFAGDMKEALDMFLETRPILKSTLADQS